MWKILSPGDIAADLVGLADENRMILRMFVNVLVWGAIAIGVVLYAT